MDIYDIVKGGDERIKLKENGLNKYHGNPLIYESVFNRGSCTMSNLNVDSKKAVDNMLKKLKNEDYDKLLNQQQKQLKKLIDVNSLNDFDIFYAPSKVTYAISLSCFLEQLIQIKKFLVS